MTNLVQVIKKIVTETVEASQPSCIVMGVVTSVSPLTVTVEQRLTLTENFLILTNNVMDHEVDMDISATTDVREVRAGHTHEFDVIETVTSESNETVAEGGQGIHVHDVNINYHNTTDEASMNADHDHNISGTKKILLRYGLKQGENVLMVRVQGGQRYVIIDRLNKIDVKGEWVE